VAKFYGKVGYGQVVDKGNGVHELVITERSYYGDVIRNTRRFQTNENVNDDLTVGNSISIVADPYANDHFFAIQYVEWTGTLWKISEVEVQSPRLILRLGGVYNGPT
jgi:hypothetical protein